MSRGLYRTDVRQVPDRRTPPRSFRDWTHDPRRADGVQVPGFGHGLTARAGADVAPRSTSLDGLGASAHDGDASRRQRDLTELTTPLTDFLRSREPRVPAYGESLADEKAATTTMTAFVERALAWFADHGVTTRRVMTDGAMELHPQRHTARAIRPAQNPPHRHAALRSCPPSTGTRGRHGRRARRRIGVPAARSRVRHSRARRGDRTWTWAAGCDP